ncbi:hypothetical protein BU23DRAFT_545623, partial [Bimuria novae-zelandiae CBS 107.79]
VTSVAFSHDSTRLASASHDRTVKIWDASSGACLQTLESYSSTVNYDAVHQGTALSSDSTWISNNTQNLVWLPTEYRPTCSTISGTCVGLGTGSGKVWICRFI